MGSPYMINSSNSRNPSPQVDLDMLHQWLYCAHLHSKTETAICVVQEQTMTTNYVRKKMQAPGRHQVYRAP
eukprot:15341721-Ditylum_brightwellii.AAC.1